MAAAGSCNLSTVFDAAQAITSGLSSTSSRPPLSFSSLLFVAQEVAAHVGSGTLLLSDAVSVPGLAVKCYPPAPPGRPRLSRVSPNAARPRSPRHSLASSRLWTLPTLLMPSLSPTTDEGSSLTAHDTTPRPQPSRPHLLPSRLISAMWRVMPRTRSHSSCDTLEPENAPGPARRLRDKCRRRARNEAKRHMWRDALTFLSNPLPPQALPCKHHVPRLRGS